MLHFIPLFYCEKETKIQAYKYPASVLGTLNNN